MVTRLRKTLGRLAWETDAAEIAETAAVLPIMFMILLGIFWFGQAYNLYGAITRAAQEGARAGVAPYCTTCTPGANNNAQNAANAIVATLTAQNLNPNAVQSPATPPSVLSCLGGGGPALCDHSASSIVNACVQTSAQLTSTVVAGAPGVCGTIVTFQYPFNFSIPFVSDTTGIMLTATARVRSETH